MHSPSHPACHCCGNRWEGNESWTAVWARKRVMNSRPYNTNTTMFFLFWLPFYCIKFLKFNSHLYILHFNKYERWMYSRCSVQLSPYFWLQNVLHVRIMQSKKLILLMQYSEGWSTYVRRITGRKCLCCIQALRALAKLRKTPISFVMSVCPSVGPFAWNKSAPTERIFVKIDIWVFFRRSVGKIQVSLISDRNNRYFTWRPIMYF